MKKKLTALVLSVLMVFGVLPISAFTAFAADDAGATTVTATEITATYDWYSAEADTYTIDTVADLAGLGMLTNGAVDGITDVATNFEGKTVQLANDLTFGENEYWFYKENDAGGNTVTSMNYRIKNFAGTFDGQGYTIYGLKMAAIYATANTSSNSGMALFRTFYGTLKNLTVEDVTITSVGGYDYLYPLVYKVDAGATVENCHSKNVNIYATGDVLASGLIGSNYGTVNNCTATDVTIVADGASQFRVIGGMFRGLFDDCAVSGCTATNISITVKGNSGYIGGFCPLVNKGAVLEDCSVNGAKMYLGDSETSELGCVGGFASNTQNSSNTVTTFTNCTVTGLDMVLKGTYSNAYNDNMPGGFIGSLGNDTVLTNCSVSGTIDATNTSADYIVGGFVGDYGWGNDCHSTFVGCTANVKIVASGAAGGFVGQATPPSVALNQNLRGTATMTGCTATGDVTSLSAEAGGFVGVGDRGTYENCTATGDVVGVVAGGFWGEITPDVSNAENKTLEISGCAASGAVLGTEVASGFVGTVLTTEGETLWSGSVVAEVTVEVDNSTASPVVAGATNTTTVSAFIQDTTPNEFTSKYTAANVTESVETITVVSENTTLTLENGKVVIPADATVKVNEDEVYMEEGGTINASAREFIVEADKNSVVIGETVTVTVTLSGYNLVGAEWALSYDSNSYELVSSTLGANVMGSADGWAIPAGNAFSGKELLATYTFKAKVQAPVDANAFTVTNTDVWTIDEANTSDDTAIPGDVIDADVTVVDPEYLVQTNEFISGKQLVLVYTNSNVISFNYNGATMYKMVDKYAKEGYANTFAIVVDAIENGDLAAYEAEVAIVYAEVATEYVLTYNATDYDLNDSGEFNLRDVTVVYGVYNRNASTYANYMNIVLNADIDANGVVNGADTAIFVNAYNAN